MLKTNYHTHHSICDGEGRAEDYVLAALRQGFTALGFSSHAPLPFPNHWTMRADAFPAYRAEILRLRQVYAGRIEIYIGLETDFISAVSGSPARLSWPPPGQPPGAELDYSIASIHVFPGGPRGCRDIDGETEDYEAIRDQNYGGDIRAFAEGYFGCVKELALRFRPPVLGHIDLIKKNNLGEKYFREEEAWYRNAVRDIVPAIAESGSIVEVNTGGLARGRTNTVYPSPFILAMLNEAGVPVMLNSDAHIPQNIDAYFDEALAAIRAAGYREVRVLRPGGWEADNIL